MSAAGAPGRTQQQTATKLDSSPFLRSRAPPSQPSLPRANSASVSADEVQTKQKQNAAAGWTKGLQPVIEVFSRKNSFSGMDETILERKGSADSQASLGTERMLTTNDGPLNAQTERAFEHQALVRTASDKSTGPSPSSTLFRGGCRLAAEVKAPEWLTPTQTRTSSIQNALAVMLADSPDNHTDSATTAHIDQTHVIDSLQHIHEKLDTMARHLGIASSGHKAIPSLISAHRGSDQTTPPDAEQNQQMDSLISQGWFSMSCPRGQQGQCLHQVEATLQQPAARAPAIAPDSGSSESNSIGAEIRKQLDLVGEQLASKGYGGFESETGHLAAQVSRLSDQLHTAQAAAAAAQQEMLQLQCKQQELASLRGQLLEAESAAAGAVKEAAQLRQQLRSAQSRNQNQPADAAVLSRQTSSVFDQVMKETYEALKDEFQSNVVYKGAEVEHVIKSVMRKQALVAQQAALDICHIVEASSSTA
ncbi:hypothetical protein ABBQ32_001716 [Trebouxia sp. C0010 RCD-2024]